MKRLTILLIQIFLVVTLSFAQSNDAHIEQVGGFHEAQIEQEASDGTINNYNGNFPGQGVDGVPPGVPFQDNTNGFSSSNSFAEITQLDFGNIASIIQSGTQWAKIFQIGLNNFATIAQDGSGSGVSFNPPGAASPCPPPFAPCNASSGEGSIASVYQNGDRNSANIEQNLGSNEAKIVQYGSDLEAIIHQFGDNNFASILQDFRGVSTITSLTGFRSAEIEQTNNNNIATVEQYVPTSNPIQITQDGTGLPVHIEHY